MRLIEWLRQGWARLWSYLVRGFVLPAPAPAQVMVVPRAAPPSPRVELRKSDYARARQQLRQMFADGARIHLPDPGKRWNPLCYGKGGVWEDGSRGVPRGFLFRTPEERDAVHRAITAQLPLPHIAAIEAAARTMAAKTWAPPEQVGSVLASFWASQGRAPCAG